ncbi:MAG: hypothetical protein LBE12_05480 [Planctomycetaceae bacterium]|jgi:hypothetical protein|nr:hypothetical protein [Planctomycetaceae bacterium]
MPAIKNFPFWNNMGILPPVALEMLGNSKERSPYHVTLSYFFDHFAQSQERIKILEGFLIFRAELHKLGITHGFQWLNGSFLENIEILEDRPPHDLDVVTFYQLPAEETQQSLIQKNKNIFDTAYLKSTFAIDGYFVMLGFPVDVEAVETITYWYSMWSHRRNGLWKGFVKIDLDPSQDTKVKKIIENQ